MTKFLAIILRRVGTIAGYPGVILGAGFLVLPLLWVLLLPEAYFSPASRRQITFIAVNDTYRIDGVSGDSKGGLHRVRTLRDRLERSGRQVVLIHAGDFLAPSLVSDVSR